MPGGDAGIVLPASFGVVPGATARDGVVRTVFAVGDEKQSIFSFQGAAPEAFDVMRRLFARQFDTLDLGWRFLRFHHSFRSGAAVLGCNIHDWMLGYILVVDTPWFTKTDDEGRAVLDDLPAGRYRLVAWHPRVTDPDPSLQREARLAELDAKGLEVGTAVLVDRPVTEAWVMAAGSSISAVGSLATPLQSVQRMTSCWLRFVFE